MMFQFVSDSFIASVTNSPLRLSTGLLVNCSDEKKTNELLQNHSLVSDRIDRIYELHSCCGATKYFVLFADDWGRYASIYAEKDKPSLNDVISTPNIDRIGREGVVFENAFVPVASCAPCRASLATGRYFWKCGSNAFLNTKGSNWDGYDNPGKVW